MTVQNQLLKLVSEVKLINAEDIVVVTTPGRSGSNFLCEIYEQNGFYLFREAGTDKGTELKLDYDGYYIHLNNRVRNLTFHNHIASWLPESGKYNMTAILNTRKDLVKQQLSHFVWQHLDQTLDTKIKNQLHSVWAPSNEYQENIDIEKISVSPLDLKRAIRQAIDFENTAIQTFKEKNIHYTIIYYEDLFSDHQLKILGQLGLKRPDQIWHSKSRFRASDIIDNYDELLELVWEDSTMNNRLAI